VNREKHRSTRLLKDIYQLNQHAFATDRRKLQFTCHSAMYFMEPEGFTFMGNPFTLESLMKNAADFGWLLKVFSW